MILSSLRWRIQLWHTLSLVVVVTGLLIAFFHYERRELLAGVDGRLRNALVAVLPVLTPPRANPGAEDRPGGPGAVRPSGYPGGGPPGSGVPPRGNRRPADGAMADLQQRHGERLDYVMNQNTGLFYVLYNIDGSVMRKSAGFPEAMAILDRRVAPDEVITRDRNGYRELLRGVPGPRVVGLGIPLAPVEASLRSLKWQLVGIGCTIFLLAWAGGWWLSGRALRPIETITATARRIAGGRLSERITVESADTELGRLSGVLNDTFGQLESDFLRQARFTSDASHELRTPVAVLLSKTQLTLMRERSPEEYREAMEVCQRTAQRMRELIDHMLELAAIDSGEHSWTFLPCDLAAVVRERLEELTPLAESKDILLRSKLGPASCACDANAISQIITNLVSNAIKHHRPENDPPREVTVTTGSDADGVLLQVADNGPGITGDDLPHIFDRFYRVDKARTRKTGSTGLGLSISRAIAEAHGGSLTVESRFGEGTTFFLRIPEGKVLPENPPG